MMLEYLVEEAERLMDTSISGVYSTDAFRKNLATAQKFLREAVKRAEVFEQDRDPLAGQTGVIQRAYVSSFHREIRPYTVFVPSTYDGSKPYPLISYMLSGGPTPDWRSSSEEQGRVRSESLALAEQKGFIMVWPRYRRLEAEANFFDVLPEMRKDYNIDLDRVYLMGVSGGGLASWTIGLLHPDQIAAICPISSVTITTAGPDDVRWRPHILSDERAALSAAGPGQESQVVVKARSTYYYPMNALHLPVLILHSDADTSTLVDVQARHPRVESLESLAPMAIEPAEIPGPVDDGPAVGRGRQRARGAGAVDRVLVVQDPIPLSVDAHDGGIVSHFAGVLRNVRLCGAEENQLRSPGPPLEAALDPVGGAGQIQDGAVGSIDEQTILLNGVVAEQPAPV